MLLSVLESSDNAANDEDVMDDTSGKKELDNRFPAKSTTITLNK